MPRLVAVQPVLMARDVAAAIAFYAKLGFTESFRDAEADPKYAGIARDGVELHLQWHDAAQFEPTGDRPNYRFVVDDVDGLFEAFRRNGGLSPNSAVKDTPWGTREFHVRDPAGNGLQFYRGL